MVMKLHFSDIWAKLHQIRSSCSATVQKKLKTPTFPSYKPVSRARVNNCQTLSTASVLYYVHFQYICVLYSFPFYHSLTVKSCSASQRCNLLTEQVLQILNSQQKHLLAQQPFGVHQLLLFRLLFFIVVIHAVKHNSE